MQTPPQPLIQIQKPKWTIGKIVLVGILGIINIAALLVIGFVVLFFISESLHPNPASILALVLVPIGGIALITVIVFDGMYYFIYLIRKGMSKRKKYYFATGILILAAILGFVSFSLYKLLPPSPN